MFSFQSRLSLIRFLFSVFFWNNSKSLQQIEVHPIYVSGELKKWNCFKCKKKQVQFKAREDFKARDNAKHLRNQSGGYSKLRKSTFTTVDEYLKASSAATYVQLIIFHILYCLFILPSQSKVCKMHIKEKPTNSLKFLSFFLVYLLLFFLNIFFQSRNVCIDPLSYLLQLHKF